MKTLVGHLDFTEAIALAELTERAHHIVEQVAAVEVQTRYDALFKSAGWRVVHTIQHAGTKTWALLLQRDQSAQFVAVCGHGRSGESLHGEGEAPRESRSFPFLNQFDIDKRAVDNLWRSLQAWAESYAVAYPPSGAAEGPGKAKVYQPWLAACQAVQDEIDLFFRALSGLKFVQYHLGRLPESTPLQGAANRAAIGAALRVRFGGSAGQAMLRTLEQSPAASQVVEAAGMPIPTELFDAEASTPPVWQVPETGFTLTFTGHGIGGAVALLAALRMKRSWEAHLDFPLFQLPVYTFGSPKVGNRAFVDHVNKLLPDEIHQVQNLLDPMIYGPLDEISLPPPASALPQAVSLHVPNVDLLNLRERLGMDAALGKWGDRWVRYQHVGNCFRHPGVGNAPTRLKLPLGVTPPAMPFDHDPAGYGALLVDARSHYEAISKPVQEVAKRVEEGREQLAAMVRAGGTGAQTLVAQVQSWMSKS